MHELYIMEPISRLDEMIIYIKRIIYCGIVKNFSFYIFLFFFRLIIKYTLFSIFSLVSRSRNVQFTLASLKRLTATLTKKKREKST